MTRRAILPLAFALLVAASCSKNASESAGRGSAGDKNKLKFPVEIAKVETREIVYSITAVGSVEAFETVQVTARVSGVVEQVRFTEGKNVPANQVLIEIEPDRYRLSVQAARASVERADAAKADAEAGLARREQVGQKNPGLIPGEEIETWRTKVRSSAADLALAKAALDQAELNLRDALVKAPVSGVIQTRSVQTGQYVQPGAVLATLIRRDPLLLRFKVAEPDAARLHAGMKAVFTVRSAPREYTAAITHVSASADEHSRMVAITAEINDAARAALRPGAFAEVRIPVGEATSMAVIPQTAIRPSERGFLAFVVRDGMAAERVLSIGLRTSDGFVEVLSGLTPGEALVVRGGEALRDGAQVRNVEKTSKGGEKGRAQQESPAK